MTYKRNLSPCFKRLAAILCIAFCMAEMPCTHTRAADASVISENTAANMVSTDTEMRAVWIKYEDFKPGKNFTNGTEFAALVGEMFDNCVAMGMNAVIVHVRPFSDAMYKSEYYPWSYYASGQQGKDPGFDPLQVMVYAAHQRGLEIHAWLNPYRVTLSWNGGTDVTKLSKKNPARKWLTNSKTSDDRNVLAYGGQLYYNPSVSAVQKLIVNGVKEIVQNYDVDGIHFDDYFYPAFTKDNYQTIFDAPEYEEYVARREAKGKKPVSIDRWRKDNVNNLVKTVYSAIKEINPNCVFGISPGGYIDYFDDKFRWYVDYRTWMGNDGYIDYICPQLYWSFSTLNTYPYHEVLAKWAKVKRADSVKLYSGLPVYKLNASAIIDTKTQLKDSEWYNPFILSNMVTYSRSTGDCDGYFFFDYINLVDSKNKTAVEWLEKAW